MERDTVGKPMTNDVGSRERPTHGGETFAAHAEVTGNPGAEGSRLLQLTGDCQFRGLGGSRSRNLASVTQLEVPPQVD